MHDFFYRNSVSTFFEKTIISGYHSKNTTNIYYCNISIFDLINQKKKKKTNRWNRGRPRQKTTRERERERERELRESRAREERNAECSRGEN